MSKAKSLFSLNKNKSLRLQRYGSWIAYQDQDANSTYWYNHKTGTGQWNAPDKIKSMISHSPSSAKLVGKGTKV
jgi:hypothetical protein